MRVRSWGPWGGSEFFEVFGRSGSGKHHDLLFSNHVSSYSLWIHTSPPSWRHAYCNRYSLCIYPIIQWSTPLCITGHAQLHFRPPIRLYGLCLAIQSERTRPLRRRRTPRKLNYFRQPNPREPLDAGQRAQHWNVAAF